MSSLLYHHGAPISEAAAFGLSSALSFAYLPFVKVGGLPLIAYRMPPKAIIKGLSRPFAARMRFETFRTPQAGERRLDALLEEGRLVGLQTSVYWLPYFPAEMRFHFNAHNLLVYGKDGDDYLISDPVAESVVRCPAPDLARARFARGLLAPRGLLYTLDTLDNPEPAPDVWLASIRKATRNMLAPFPLIGVRGIHTLARRVARLQVASLASRAWVGHIVRMQEEIGTGGAGFRFLYAAFLQEASTAAKRPELTQFADGLLDIGDAWREFALRAARMIRDREPFDPALLAQRLHALAERERDFFIALKSAAS